MDIGKIEFGNPVYRRFSSVPGYGLVSAGQTAFVVKCGLGHAMDKAGPAEYRCPECGFSVIVIAGGSK